MRIIQLSYSWRNFATDGCWEPRDGGLSKYGFELVDAMNKKGVLIDLSHVGDNSTMNTIEKLHQAIVEDGVPVKGYHHWTMMDNFEWSDGYRIHFGLYNVDPETKKRTPSKTVKLYREIGASNSPV